MMRKLTNKLRNVLTAIPSNPNPPKALGEFIEIVEKSKCVINCNGIKDQFAEACKFLNFEEKNDLEFEALVSNCTANKVKKNPVIELQRFWMFLNRRFPISDAVTRKKLEQIQDYFTKNLAPAKFTEDITGMFSSE